MDKDKDMDMDEYYKVNKSLDPCLSCLRIVKHFDNIATQQHSTTSAPRHFVHLIFEWMHDIYVVDSLQISCSRVSTVQYCT